MDCGLAHTFDPAEQLQEEFLELGTARTAAGWHVRAAAALSNDTPNPGHGRRARRVMAEQSYFATHQR